MKIYNSLTRTKESFVPQDPNLVTMYFCGPTVWDTPHLGNARASVVGDLLFRVLSNRFGRVKYARNITDIDDKIINKAKETGQSIGAITTGTTKIYHDAMAALNILTPSVEPKATESIDDMVALTELLLDKGYAYVGGDDLYFDLSKLSDDFPSLARHDVEDLVQQNVDDLQGKRHKNDFALWKSDKNHPDWTWDHPVVGSGRPGWHLECSAMIKHHLGQTIDVHGGGGDLRFPHHEAEMAQSFAAHDAPLANYWMHNGMITVDGKKMGKSSGNFITVEEALTRYPGESIRFYMLKTHYRKPFDWTWEGLDAAHNELSSLYRKIQQSAVQLDGIAPSIINAMADDLNTPLAISLLHEEGDADHSALKESGRFLGLFSHEPDDWFKIGAAVGETEIDDLISERNVARANKDFETSDRIRDELKARGIVLEDSGDTTTWRKE